MVVTPSRKRQSAFTLAEIVIAIGIIASVSIPMVAILAYGLDNMQESRAILIKTRIERHLATTLNQSDWGNTNNLDDFQASLWYYDEQGTVLEDESDDRVIYVARLGLDVDSDGKPEDPGLLVPGATTKNREMRRATVTISDRPRLEDPFESEGGTTSFSFIVTRTDRR